MGAALRDRRGASPGAPGLQGNLQPNLDHRAARLQDARSDPRRSDRPDADGRVSAEPCLKTVDRYTTEGLERSLGALGGPAAVGLPRLMGLEGAGAAAYFEGLASLFAPALGFTGRNRRP